MIGFLHTAEAHTATFTDLLQEIAPGAPSMHLVDESLLIDAQARGGVDPELEARLAAALRELAAARVPSLSVVARRSAGPPSRSPLRSGWR